MRDITLGDTHYFKFTTRQFSTGAPYTLAGTPVISAYLNGSTTQITSGITLTVDFDGVTGLNSVAVAATSGNGYSVGDQVALVITTGTVDSVSVVGEVVAEFTIGAMADNVLNAVAGSYLTAGTVGEALALGSAALADTTITGTPTSTALQLTAGSSVDNFYNDQLVYILSGTGIGQVRPVSSYNGTTKTLTVDEPFAVTPAASDRVAIIVTHVHPVTSIRDEILADSTPFNGASIATILADVIAILVDTADMQPKLGTPAADISADIAAVKSDSGAIKTKTDNLTFTKANEVDSNVKSVNGVTIVGDGSATPFNV